MKSKKKTLSHDNKSETKKYLLTYFKFIGTTVHIFDKKSK